jgi:glycosyltransferase involved in cell wall biosynthesis
MIHDLIPITHPEYCRAGEAARHVERVRNMLASAVGIIGNSQATLDSLAAFAAQEGVATPAMIAAPLGTDLRPSDVDPRVPPKRPTFVMLGTIEGRKNHLLLLQIWARLVRAYGAKAPRLLIIGQRGWECEQVFDLLDRSEILRGAVEEVSHCSDAQLDGHLRGARALLFPTLVEGYGLPLIEALATGTPVIASDLPVFHEIGQEVPDFIDPLDGPAWQAAIETYAQDSSFTREAQVKRLAGYRAPTWDGHFARITEWLATL